MKQLNVNELPNSGKAHELKATIETEYGANNNNIKHSSEIRIYLDNSRFYYYTGVLDMIQDENDLILINHYDQTIKITNPIAQKLAVEQMEKLNQFRDTLIISSYEKGCLQKDENLAISLQLPMALREKSHVSDMVVRFNQQNEQIESIKLFYSNRKDIKSVTTTYELMAFNRSQDRPIAVRYKIFDKQENLLKKYQGYQLIKQ